MKHDNKCKLAMVIGRLETLLAMCDDRAIWRIIEASLGDLRDIFGGEEASGDDIP